MITPETPAPTPRFVYCTECAGGRTTLTAPDGRDMTIVTAANGPPMFTDPKGRYGQGRPTSIYDVLYNQSGGVLGPGQHAVPKADENGRRDWATFNPLDCEVLTAARLHKEATARQPRIKADPKTARRIKTAYYTRGASLTELAGLKDYGGLSKATLSRIVRGESLWYA